MATCDWYSPLRRNFDFARPVNRHPFLPFPSPIFAVSEAIRRHRTRFGIVVKSLGFTTLVESILSDANNLGKLGYPH